MSKTQTTIKELNWAQARDRVAALNPEFAAIIDEISPDKNYKLFLASYPYGEYVLRHGKMQLPNKNGELVAFDDPSHGDTYSKHIGYNLGSNPVSMVLQNSFEIFLPLDDRTIPLYGLIQPGSIFGTYKILNPQSTNQPAFIWDMTAGSRSMFLLPKVTEAEKHFKLMKKYRLNVAPPKNLVDHWSVFKGIANHPDFAQSWNAEILFFSQDWFTHLNDPAWKQFTNYLYKYVWQASEYWRNQFFWDLIFSLIQHNRNLRLSPYIADTVKYLLGIGMGYMSGFSPATTEIAGPIANIQAAYINDYGLKAYPPIIMHPTRFQLFNPDSSPVYYSLQFPCSIEFGPKSRSRTTLFKDLYEIQYLLAKYVEEIAKNQFNIEKTTLFEVIKNVDFTFFHTKSEIENNICDSARMPQEDKYLLTTIDGKVYDDFPTTCAFVKGCIRITNKSEAS